MNLYHVLNITGDWWWWVKSGSVVSPLGVWMCFLSKRNITASAVSKQWSKSIWTWALLDWEYLLINTLESDIFQWPMWPKIKSLPVWLWINSLMRRNKAFKEGGKKKLLFCSWEMLLLKLLCKDVKAVNRRCSCPPHCERDRAMT